MTAVAFMVILIIGIISLSAGVVLTILDLRRSKEPISESAQLANSTVRDRSLSQELMVTMAAVVVGLAAALLFVWAGVAWWVAVLIGIAVALYAPTPLERELARRSERVAADSTADAIDGFVSLTQGGAAAEEAIATLAEQCDEPIRSELRRVQAQLAGGSSVPAAVEDARARIDSPDFDLFAAALQTQNDEIGGTPTVYTALRDMIARRRELRHRTSKVVVRTLRISVGVVSVGLILVIALLLFAPTVTQPFLDDSVGRVAFALGVCGLVAGFVVVRDLIERRVEL